MATWTTVSHRKGNKRRKKVEKNANLVAQIVEPRERNIALEQTKNSIKNIM